HHRLVREGATRAAIRLGDAGAQQPHLAGLAPHAAVGQVLAAPALLERRELALEHLAHVVAEQGDVVGHPTWRHGSSTSASPASLTMPLWSCAVSASRTCRSASFSTIVPL